MAPERVTEVAQLEQAVGQSMFAKNQYGGAQGITEVVEYASQQVDENAEQSEQLAVGGVAGCGSPFACGE